MFKRYQWCKAKWRVFFFFCNCPPLSYPDKMFIFLTFNMFTIFFSRTPISISNHVILAVFFGFPFGRNLLIYCSVFDSYSFPIEKAGFSTPNDFFFLYTSERQLRSFVPVSSIPLWDHHGRGCNRTRIGSINSVESVAEWIFFEFIVHPAL